MSAVYARPISSDHKAAPEPGVPGIHAVIVNYNAGPLLARCVRMVLESDIPVTVSVVDNASTDGSVAELERRFDHVDDVNILKNNRNLGFAGGSNRALSDSRSEYVVFINPDCFVRPDALRKLREALETHPEAGMAGCLVLDPDGGEQPGTRRSIPTPWRSFVRIFHLDRLFPSHPRFRNFVETGLPLPRGPTEVEGISGAMMFVRRNALEEVGSMDEGYFLHCEDLDWFMRFRAAGWKILFVPDAVVTHVKGACSVGEPVRVLWHKHNGMVRFYRKFFRHQYPLPLMWLVVTAVWGRFGLLAASTAFNQVRSRVSGRKSIRSRTRQA